MLCNKKLKLDLAKVGERWSVQITLYLSTTFWRTVDDVIINCYRHIILNRISRYIILRLIYCDIYVVSDFVISLYPDYWHGPMAHGYFFRYVGMALAFGLHSAVCNTTKLYCLSVALVVAVVLYGWLEWRLQLTGKRRRTANRSSWRQIGVASGK